jgi:hypothetical protein
VLPIGALVWAGLMIAASRGLGARWSASVPRALAIGVAVLAFVLLPDLTRSSLGGARLGGDWVKLLGVALGFGAWAALLAWPPVSMRNRSGLG